MNIGLDLDEVVADFFEALLKFYHKKTGKLYTKEEFPEFKWWPLLGATREEAVKFVDEFHETHNLDEVKPLEHAITSVNHLLKNNKLFIITSRPIRFKPKVESWIEHHFGTKIEVTHAGDWHKGQAATKADICKELKIPLILEDAPDTALSCANAGIKVILFDNPWNRSIKHKDIIRVKNWLEALESIEHFKKL